MLKITHRSHAAQMLAREVTFPSPSKFCAAGSSSLWSSQKTVSGAVSKVVKLFCKCELVKKLDGLSSFLLLLLNCVCAFGVFLCVEISKNLYPKHCSSYRCVHTCIYSYSALKKPF